MQCRETEKNARKSVRRKASRKIKTSKEEWRKKNVKTNVRSGSFAVVEKQSGRASPRVGQSTRTAVPKMCASASCCAVVFIQGRHRILPSLKININPTTAAMENITIISIIKMK